MDTFEAISSRRAIKKFDPSHKMTSDEVDSLMKLTILSPTSYNQQNWRFVTVTDQSIKEKNWNCCKKSGTTCGWFFGHIVMWKHECLEGRSFEILEKPSC